MVLVLKNDQMENLLPMAEEIDAIEAAFRELGEGKAMNAPRARLRTPWKEEGGQYYFNNIMGLVPGVKSMALRIDSSFSKEVQVAGSKRRVYPGDYIGLVMLFDMDTCEILALMDDHYISTMRVGATSAVASKYLARKDAKVMALLGSGEQAKTQVTAHSCVRQLKQIKVYSPTKENRERFATELSQETGIEVIPVASAEAAIRGSDIVTAATNTVDPVIQGKWVEDGMHLNSIVGGDGSFSTNKPSSMTALSAAWSKPMTSTSWASYLPANAAAARTTKRLRFSRTTPAWASSSPPRREKCTRRPRKRASAPNCRWICS
jgi:alanine dehydrogenase